MQTTGTFFDKAENIFAHERQIMLLFKAHPSLIKLTAFKTWR
ncbi:Uncharacterised protein [Vibrio cholerae]|nr:Uncharacterised protein [Vibrio cholerae]